MSFREKSMKKKEKVFETSDFHCLLRFTAIARRKVACRTVARKTDAHKSFTRTIRMR